MLPFPFTHLFLMPYTHLGSWRAIDFGLARKHLDEQGHAYPARADAAFRGSRTYASVHAHRETDLGRRDDLWSWYYMLVWLLQCCDTCLVVLHADMVCTTSQHCTIVWLLHCGQSL